ncbi:MAG: hypothetical protein K6E76_05530 [Patescibacteria group bacterium]|nr:hypothetical protein [Patescibacteria group bacterium]
MNILQDLLRPTLPQAIFVQPCTNKQGLENTTASHIIFIENKKISGMRTMKRNDNQTNDMKSTINLDNLQMIVQDVSILLGRKMFLPFYHD